MLTKENIAAFTPHKDSNTIICFWQSGNDTYRLQGTLGKLDPNEAKIVDPYEAHNETKHLDEIDPPIL